MVSLWEWLGCSGKFCDVSAPGPDVPPSQDASRPAEEALALLESDGEGISSAAV